MGLKRGRLIVCDSSSEEKAEDNNSKRAKRTGGKNCNMNCFLFNYTLIIN